MLPLAALFVAFFVAPLIVLLALSLHADTATATWTAANYVKFFTDRFNYSILWDTLLLGVKAVITESFERIHRSNLVGMGVLPLTFKEGMDRKTLGLKGDELIDILGLDHLAPRMDIKLSITRANGTVDTVDVLCRVDTADEVNYYRHGGILQYVLRGMAKAA